MSDSDSIDLSENKRSHPTVVMMWLVWIAWLLLFLTWPADLMLALLKDNFQFTPQLANDELFPVFLFMGIINLALTFGVRWFTFTFLINEKRTKPGSAGASVIGTFGALIIFGLTKSVEIFGLILFLKADLFLEDLIFWIPSLIVFVVHLPAWMIPKRVIYSETFVEA